ISFQVLQGFTCTRVQSFNTLKVKNLIRGCRRRGKNKVTLQESQLTCMNNYIRSETVTAFTDYPADMLLYYNVSQVQPSICQSYYSALSEADFSLFSATLAYRRDDLFRNARQCLGVSGFSVSQSQLDVMGQMVCVFNSSYILNSDPYVLEKLKLCSTLTAGQSSSVETVLLRGNTVYGAPATWNQTTLTSLGVLPLYLTSNFWSYFTKKEKVEFLRVFVPRLKQRGMSRQSISTLISQAGKASITRSSSLLRLRRDTACTVGEITQVQASDASFPFGYDVNQFDACLSVQTLKDNLAAITDKAMGSDFQTVILKKLNQAYPAGISDEVLQVLGPASRAASISDISKWNVTSIMTLAALMRSYDGAWSSEQVRALVSMYVTGNRTLGYLELNALGGTNLCALDINLLKNITSINLQTANPLSVSNCSLEKKQVLFSIAQSAFSGQTLNKSTRATSTISTNTYQLIQSYLIRTHTHTHTHTHTQTHTHTSTKASDTYQLIQTYLISEVQGLLGTNLPDLKTYENNQVVHSWITQQLQSDLDTLGIGLTGGR
ncbi:mesothelin isoform X1, partial [Silurus asotus]